jgi:uncharacterized membrane protein
MPKSFWRGKRKEIAMKEQIMLYIGRLKKPSTIISLTSQVVSILLLLGVHINQTEVMGIAAAICSLLVTMGVLSNPDSNKKGYGDDLKICSNDGNLTKHVLVNGQMVCEECGAVYKEPETEEPAEQNAPEEPITQTEPAPPDEPASGGE